MTVRGGKAYARGDLTSTKAVALPTSANGINDKGRLVGSYVDANGNTDGFVATPTPEPSSLVLLGIELIGLVHGFRKRRA